MSFMYNPFPFDDPKPVNRPELSEKTISARMQENPTRFWLLTATPRWIGHCF